MIYFIVYLLVIPFVFDAAEAIDEGNNFGVAMFWPISLPVAILIAVGYKVGKVFK